MGIKGVRKGVKRKMKFDIKFDFFIFLIENLVTNNFICRELVPLKFATMCFAPALFVHGENDKFILPHHSEQM